MRSFLNLIFHGYLPRFFIGWNYDINYIMLLLFLVIYGLIDRETNHFTRCIEAGLCFLHFAGAWLTDGS